MRSGKKGLSPTERLLLALALVLWLILPGLLALIIAASGSHDYDLVEWTGSVNPVVQAVVIMEATGGYYQASETLASLDYDWPDNNNIYVGATTWRLLGSMLAYVLAGGGFALRAERRIRRSVF